MNINEERKGVGLMNICGEDWSEVVNRREKRDINGSQVMSNERESL